MKKKMILQIPVKEEAIFQAPLPLQQRERAHNQAYD